MYTCNAVMHLNSRMCNWQLSLKYYTSLRIWRVMGGGGMGREEGEGIMENNNSKKMEGL